MDEHIAEAIEELQEIRSWVIAQRERAEFSAAERARLGRLSDNVAGLALALAQLSQLAHKVKSGEFRE